jgi:polyhydroxybutyrate depolymerase
MKYISSLLLLFSITIFSQVNPGWIKNIEIQHDGTTRYFDVFVPNNLKLNPELVIQLHGGTQSKEELYDGGGACMYWKDVAEKNNFLLLVPNGTNAETGKATGNKLNWNDCRIHPDEKNADDVGFISKLIDWSIVNYKVNSKKVFVTGVSNGGLMSYRLALEIPQKITAITAFNANLYKESECKNTNIPIPVMIVNGTKDEFMPFYGGKTKFRHEDALSSQETVDFWVKNNFSGNLPKTEITKFGGSKPIKSITCTIYDPESSTNQIRYYEIEGAGHAMPGKKYVLSRFAQRIVGKQNQAIEGAELAWDFFKTISK